MSNKKKYSQLTQDELLEAKKKIEKNATLNRFLISFLVGVMIYGIANKGFGFLHIAIPLFLISGIYKYSQEQKNNLEEIQSEIKSRSV